MIRLIDIEIFIGDVCPYFSSFWGDGDITDDATSRERERHYSSFIDRIPQGFYIVYTPSVDLRDDISLHYSRSFSETAGEW